MVLIDTRNDYEVGIGTFKGAINPKKNSFSEFPEWWEENKDKFQNKKKVIKLEIQKTISKKLMRLAEHILHRLLQLLYLLP